MNKKRKNRWYKLENAAKIFPPTSNKHDPKVFRFFVEMNDNIDKTFLQQALEKTIEEFPHFNSTLKRGFFWYYLETIDKVIEVSEENDLPCDIFENKFLYRVSYYKKRINVEVNHALTDGTGTLNFLKVLVCNYEELRYKTSADIYVDDASVEEREIDSYKKYYKKEKSKDKVIGIKGYQVKGKMYPEERLKIIELIMPTKDVLKLSKDNNSTITQYLTAIMIKSIADTMSYKDKKKPIIITIPVNLRKYFPSNTARNFFNVVPIVYYVNDDNNNIEEILKSVKKQFEEGLKKEKIIKRMNQLQQFENMFILRLVPLVIKNIVLKYLYKKSRLNRTITLSNIGVIDMPYDLQKHINLFGVMSSTDNVQSCMCSYKDNLVFTFTSHFVEQEIQKNFVRYLSNNGISITVNTNIIEEDELDEKMF
ncbi:MAG: hypothetical protein MR411_05540 [Tenericutes bacterium]|nr:hypothetical protein [Mycoplasmatota bacterium]